MVKKYGDLYLEACRALSTREDRQTAGFLAKNLLCSASGLPYEIILAKRDMYASEKICEAMEASVSRVLTGEPLAYVLGEWDFYGMTLEVNHSVLIPRDDTCAVTETAIKQARLMGAAPRILDLCTGSGCIGLAIAKHIKDAKMTLADISREALAVAKNNVKRQKLTGRVACVVANALDVPPAYIGKFDMIVSNPPYITTGEMEELDHSVKDFEPHLALHGGDDGLVFYRSIAEKYGAALKPGGYLCFEFGLDQGDAVCRILEQNQYDVLDRVKDYNNRERAVLAQNCRKED